MIAYCFTFCIAFLVVPFCWNGTVLFEVFPSERNLPAFQFSEEYGTTFLCEWGLDLQLVIDSMYSFSGRKESSNLLIKAESRHSGAGGGGL